MNARFSLASVVCVALSTSLAIAPCVRAAGPGADEATEDPDELSSQAVERFNAKDYDGAVALFERAHAIDPQPNYLFNIGRVYEEKGDLEKAVEYYQRFLGQSGVDLESRQSATERLRILREALRQMRADEEGASPAPTPTDDGRGDPATETTTPTDTDPSDDGRKRKLRIAGYSLLGVGGVALIVGGVVGGIALGTSNDADDAEFVDDKLDARSRAKTQANVADGLFISGGVIAAVGLVLVLSTLGKRKGAATARTQWTPQIGPRHVGLGLTHRF
jgi:tetratricopeptide (TPR) repeat protein